MNSCSIIHVTSCGTTCCRFRVSRQEMLLGQLLTFHISAMEFRDVGVEVDTSNSASFPPRIFRPRNLLEFSLRLRGALTRPSSNRCGSSQGIESAWKFPKKIFGGKILGGEEEAEFLVPTSGGEFNARDFGRHGWGVLQSRR